jgi:hypothetical protein
MKIVTDTNKFYDLGTDTALLQNVSQEPITPTFISLKELTTTGRMLENEGDVRQAIRAMLRFENNMIVEPPFLFLAKVYREEVFIGIDPPNEDLIIARRFAAGGRIAPENADAFYDFVRGRRAELQKGADIFNNEAIRIKERIGEEVRQHLAFDSLPLTAEFVQYLVSNATDGAFDLEGFTSEKFELLLVVLDRFFKRIETSPMLFQPNDLFDFALLAYVQPGDKLWTRDGRWINIINEAGMGHYLYQPPS